MSDTRPCYPVNDYYWAARDATSSCEEANQLARHMEEEDQRQQYEAWLEQKQWEDAMGDSE